MDKKSRILKEKAMKKCVALISFLMFLPVMVQAQKEYPIEQVSAINVGDYGAQNETYIEGWEKKTSKLLIYKRLCKI